MKYTPPDKIFIHKKDLSYSEVKESDSDITFIRKDALLEWAKEELGNTSILRSETIETLQKVIDKLNSM